MSFLGGFCLDLYAVKKHCLDMFKLDINIVELLRRLQYSILTLL